MTARAQSLETSTTLRQTASRPPWRQTLRRLAHHRAALFGAVIVALLIVIAIIGPRIAPYDEREIAGKSLTSPNADNWMGTDALGRDVMSRILNGARISIVVGIFSVAIGLSSGTLLGLLAGYYRGAVDTAVTMLVDTMLAFPGILLAIAIISVLGPSLQNAMIAVGIGSFPAYARLVRGSVMSAKEHDYVEAARVLGAKDSSMMVKHVLPNVIAPVIVLSTLRIGTAILTAAGLSFLGLGAQPPTPEWGAMINDGRNYLRVAWWVTTFPGIAIMITVLAVNQLGDGLRDALDPRSQT